VEDENFILKECQRAIEVFHDPARYAMVRVALAPCSPFSVTPDLMRESVALARSYAFVEHGPAGRVRLHTHLAETLDEEQFCLDTFGSRPVDYVESLGWTGDDVWHAHCVHMNAPEIALFARSRTGVAHCPASNMRLASGIAPIRALRDAGALVGLGVDGSASNDSGHLLAEARHALLLQRVLGNAAALSAREALELATLGGAAVLGRDDIGALATGMAADFIGYRLERLAFTGALHDPLAALVFCTPVDVDLSVINGQVRVQEGQFVDWELQPLIRRHNIISRAMVRKERVPAGE
jgi:cytosine/adenosine deaminase-related metal-dependent hydrolase